MFSMSQVVTDSFMHQNKLNIRIIYAHREQVMAIWQGRLSDGRLCPYAACL